jgi:pyruvate dehydrogenase E1 component alpha subunit
MYGDGAANQG